MKHKKTALILGATGLVGSHLLHILLSSDYDKVHVLSRRTVGYHHPKLQEHITPLEELHQHIEAFHVDDLYCCLGTTIKQAGSQEKFFRVDHDFPLQAATLAKQVGHIKQFFLVSSAGANSNSFFFYSRVKGRIEHALKQLDLPALHIFQPTLLLGQRQQTRPGERIFSFLTRKLRFLFHGPLYPLRGIDAKKVAQAIFEVSLISKKGTHTYTAKQMEELLYLI